MGRFPLRKIFPKTPAIWPSPARTELGAGAPPEHKGKRTSHRRPLFLPLFFCGPFRGPHFFGILDLAFGPQATTPYPLFSCPALFLFSSSMGHFEVLKNWYPQSGLWVIGHPTPLSLSPVLDSFSSSSSVGHFRGAEKFGIFDLAFGPKATTLSLSLSLPSVLCSFFSYSSVGHFEVPRNLASSICPLGHRPPLSDCTNSLIGATWRNYTSRV